MLGGKKILVTQVQLFATPWTVGHYASLSLGISKPEYWNGLPFPSSVDLSNPGIKTGSLALQADSLPSESPEEPDHVSIIMPPALGKLTTVFHHK